MLRRFARAAALSVTVPLLTAGFVVSSSGAAQAEVIWGASERAGIALLERGLARGVAGGAPTIIARGLAQESKCVASGPGAAACLALTTAGIAVVTGLGLTADKWMPWLWDQAGMGSADKGPNPNAGVPVGDITWLDKPDGATGLNTLSIRVTLPQWDQSANELYVPIGVSGRCVGGHTWERGGYAIDGQGVGAGSGGGHWDLTFPDVCAAYGTGVNLESVTVTPGQRAHNDLGTITYTGQLTWQVGGSNGVVTAQLQCQRPDGSQYQVNADAEPRDGHALIPHCDPGDTPLDLRLSTPTIQGPKTDLRGDDPTTSQKYPKCVGQACVYTIYADGKPCVAGAEACVQWAELVKLQPDRFECLYGPYSVAFVLCHWLESAYEVDADRRVITIPNTDGNPLTRGEQIYPRPNPNPNPDPTPSPSSSTSPNPTGTASPTVTVPVDPAPKTPPVQRCLEGDPLCRPVVDPENPAENNDECWPNGWGVINPANWVLQPMKCAFKWAFVPPPGTIDGFRTKVALDWNGSTPGRWINALPPIWTNIGGNVGSGGGCKGPPVPLGYLSNMTGLPSSIWPFDACDAPVSYIASIVHASQSFALSFFGGLRAVQVLGAGFGFVMPAAYAYRDYTDADIKGAWK